MSLPMKSGPVSIGDELMRRQPPVNRRVASRIVKKKEATEEERALYEAWLGRPWDEKEDEEPIA